MNPSFSIPDGARPFGWAGFFLHTPAAFKLLQVSGVHARGLVRLVDTDRIRLAIGWATVYKKKFDAPKFIERQLFRTLAVGNRAERKRGKAIAEKCIDPRLPGMTCALMATDDENRTDRIIGYCAATSRVFDIAYQHGLPAENALIKQGLVDFIDQPVDRPAKWAFFNSSFISPVGFTYGNSRLNLGDMQVQLLVRRTDLTGPGLLVRQIYPARLALSRVPIENWMHLWTRALSPTWRIEGCGLSGKRPPKIRHRTVEITRAGGTQILDAIETRGSLRYLFRPFLFRAPKSTRILMWHDEVRDRIIALHCSHREQEIDSILNQVALGLNWAPEYDS